MTFVLLNRTLKRSRYQKKKKFNRGQIKKTNLFLRIHRSIDGTLIQKKKRDDQKEERSDSESDSGTEGSTQEMESDNASVDSDGSI